MGEPSNEVIGKVRSWLEGEGYPLELRTAREFRRQGADVIEGRYYIDPDTDEPREIDVIAVFEVVGDQTQKAATVSFVVECKSQRNDARPWVMFTIAGDDLELSWRPHQTRFGAKLKAVGQGWVPNRACIDVGGRLAHAAVQAKMGESKKNEPDPAFSAVMSATKASFWWSTSHFGIPDEQPHIVFPVVVVDAPLISCALPRDGDELEIELIPSAITLRSLRPIGNRGVTAVDVVTASALADYVSQSATMAYDLGLRLIADTH